MTAPSTGRRRARGTRRDPPFAEYVSGRSTFSRAAAEVLAGGIHFQDGDLRGREMVRLIGRQVLAHARSLWGDSTEWAHRVGDPRDGSPPSPAAAGPSS